MFVEYGICHPDKAIDDRIMRPVKPWIAFRLARLPEASLRPDLDHEDGLINLDGRTGVPDRHGKLKIGCERECIHAVEGRSAGGLHTKPGNDKLGNDIRGVFRP